MFRCDGDTIAVLCGSPTSLTGELVSPVLSPAGTEPPSELCSTWGAFCADQSDASQAYHASVSPAHFHPRARARPGDSFGCHTWGGATGTQWERPGMLLNTPQGTKRGPAPRSGRPIRGALMCPNMKTSDHFRFL